MKAEFQPATWKAFWECAIGGRPASAVARELGISENAVYLARGRVARRCEARFWQAFSTNNNPL